MSEEPYETLRDWSGEEKVFYTPYWQRDVDEGIYDFEDERAWLAQPEREWHDTLYGRLGPADPFEAELDVLDPVLEPQAMMAGSVTQCEALSGADGHELQDRGEFWREPSECRCTSWDKAARRRVKVSHTGRRTCQRCFLEFLAKSRKALDATKGSWVFKTPDDEPFGQARPRWDPEAPGFVYDPDGRVGCFWKSGLIDGRFRTHAVRVPEYGDRPALWLVVMSEEIGTSVWQKSQTERVVIQIIDIIGYHEARDREEATLQAIELQQTLVLTNHAANAGWDNLAWTDKLGWMQSQEEPVPMGAASLSPEYLERFADSGYGRTAGVADSGE